MTNFGGVDVVPLRATVRCHYSALWLGGRKITKFGEWCHCCATAARERATTKFGGVDVMPLLCTN